MKAIAIEKVLKDGLSKAYSPPAMNSMASSIASAAQEAAASKKAVRLKPEAIQEDMPGLFGRINKKTKGSAVYPAVSEKSASIPDAGCYAEFVNGNIRFGLLISSSGKAGSAIFKEPFTRLLKVKIIQAIKNFFNRTNRSRR